MFDVVALRSLSVVDQLGSVSAAASALGYTPSAVSQQIKRLEHQIGTALFEAAGRGIVLTPAAKALTSHADDVFAALERCESSARRASSAPVSGVIRLAGFSTAIRGLVAPAMAGLKAVYPGLDLRVRELDALPALQALHGGLTDVVLLHDEGVSEPPPPKGCTLSHVGLDTGDVIVRRDHRLAHAGRTVEAAELQSASWVASPQGTVCHDWLRLLAVRSSASLEILHTIDDFSTQIALVGTGQVAALIPRLARPPLPADVIAIPLDEPPGRRIFAATRTSAEQTPALQVVLSTLASEAVTAGLAPNK